VFCRHRGGRQPNNGRAGERHRVVVFLGTALAANMSMMTNGEKGDDERVSVHVEKHHAERQERPSVGAPTVDRRWVVIDHDSRDK
jgi:hypothetical protein